MQSADQPGDSAHNSSQGSKLKGDKGGKDKPDKPKNAPVAGDKKSEQGKTKHQSAMNLKSQTPRVDELSKSSEVAAVLLGLPAVRRTTRRQ